MPTLLRRLIFLAFALIIEILGVHVALACTGITLRAKDGAIVYGRTMEWGSFDLNSRLIVIPRGYKFSGHTPEGKPGLNWTAKYGVAGIDGIGKDIVLDGMNEKGMTVGVFYHPDFAVFPKYEASRAEESIGPTDVGHFLLTTCSTVDECRKAMARILVAPVVEEAIGIVPPVHYLVIDPSGDAVAIEFLKGEMKIFEAPLGVMTNSPSYDWHETNIRNFVNLTAVAVPERHIGNLDLKPLGGGSGMIGLPGDFTPPSRFVRATAFSQTARPTGSGEETMYELFRILDNFNVPLGSAEGGGVDKTKGMRSATLWTTCHDTKNRVLYYHTQHNRRVRRFDLGKLDFDRTDLVHLPLDKVKAQDFENLN